MDPSPNNTIRDSSLNNSYDDPCACISYDQPSFVKPAWMDETRFTALDSDEYHQNQGRVNVANASGVSIPDHFESQVQTEVDRRSDEWDSQRNHNGFYESQLTKSPERPIQDNSEIYFYQEASYFSPQNESHSGDQDLPNVKDRLSHELHRALQQPLDSVPVEKIIDNHSLEGSDFQSDVEQETLMKEAQTLATQQESNRALQQPLASVPIVKMIDGHGLGGSDFQSGAEQGTLVKEAQTLATQQESNRALQQPLASVPIVKMIDGRGLEGSDLQSNAEQGTLAKKAQILVIQQESVQLLQSLQNVPPRREERTDSVEGDEPEPEADPSKKLKVEGPQTHSTACSTDNPSSAGSLEGSPQKENYNDGMHGVDGTSSHMSSEEEHKQHGVNEAAFVKRKTTKARFAPHRSALKTIANSILRYLKNDFLFRWNIEQEICIPYRIPMKNIETYIERLVKGSVANETELFNAIGNAGPKGLTFHFLLKEEAKRATWLLFQILLGHDGHFERWVDDPINGYQPGSKSEKGKEVDKESEEYREKQEEKRKIYKKEGEREKLRKIFENPKLSANPKKGKKKDTAIEKNKPEKKEGKTAKRKAKKKEEKKEEYIVYEEPLFEEASKDNDS